MGTLVAKKYPAYFSSSPADHTYVECGTGQKVWLCWGNKTIGTAFKTGTASTIQANSVAQPDGKAGITCYGVNGVCHQAANRILIHAEVLVSGARGYQISQAIFGPYGRSRSLPFGWCRGLFNQYSNVTGDSPECATPPGFSIKTIEPAMTDKERDEERVYVRRLIARHIDGERTLMVEKLDRDALVEYQLALFREQVRYRLGASIWEDLWGRLAGIRRALEEKRLPLEEAYANREVVADVFAKYFDELTVQFQNDCANALKEQDYMALLEMKPGDVVTLIDTDMLRALGNDTDPSPSA